MTKDICARNVVLLEQPANERGGSGSLLRGDRIDFSADVLDSDSAAVRALAMPGRIAVAHGLVDVAISIDDIMGGDRIFTAGGLEMIERTLERRFGAMQYHLVDLGAVA